MTDTHPTDGPDDRIRNLTSVRSARWRRIPWSLRQRAVVSELQRRSPERLAARLHCADYARLAATVTGAGTAIRTVDSPDARLNEDAPVWQFWATGASNAPPLVRRCLESVAEHTHSRPRVMLDADSYGHHVTLPAHIEAKRLQMGWTHFSDILRVHLLAEHGGTWIDATVLLTEPVPPDLASQPFFAFTRPEDPFLLSSWFLQSVAGHPIVTALAAMVDAYWESNDSLVDYFLFHFLFESAVTADEQLRSAWMATPVRSYLPPHQLQGMLCDPFDEVACRRVMGSSWIHKLAWKLPSGTDGAGTVAEWLASP